MRSTGTSQTPWADPAAADDAQADDALAAMVNLLVVLADNKYRLGRHLSEWAVGSPSLEVGVATAAIAQGELGQARVLYPLLDDLPFPGTVDPAKRTRGYHLSLLDAPFPSWPHAVAGLLLVDTATTTMLEALAGSVYEPLARRVPRMLEEEAFHWDFADGRVRELARLPGGIQQLQARVDESAAEVLCWFGPPGEPGVEALRRHQLLGRDTQELRDTYADRVGGLLAEAGVTLHPPLDSGTPADPDRTTRRLDAEQLPWTRWNRLQRRLEPTPTRPATTP